MLRPDLSSKGVGYTIYHMPMPLAHYLFYLGKKRQTPCCPVPGLDTAYCTTCSYCGGRKPLQSLHTASKPVKKHQGLRFAIIFFGDRSEFFEPIMIYHVSEPMFPVPCACVMSPGNQAWQRGFCGTCRPGAWEGWRPKVVGTWKFDKLLFINLLWWMLLII